MMMIMLMFLFYMMMILMNFYLKMYFLMLILLMMIFIILLKFIMINNIWVGIYWILGMDKYSFGLVILSMWIIMLMIISVKNIYIFNLYMFMIIMLLMFLMLSFFSMNYFMFYLFFEASMIPTIMLIIGWGLNPERLKSGYYMFMYTMFSSLPFLLILFILKENIFSLSFLILLNQNIYLEMSILFYFYMIFVFLVKLPIYLFHSWLPKAHVEAPLVGSMILAGVMLKLGSYGLIRSLLMMMNLSMKYNFFLYSLCLWGGVMLSLVCFIQIDLKMLVAYSSVVHMSILLMGMLTMGFIGFNGAYLMMISHGLCSSGMFYLVNMNYIRFGSRMFILNKGLFMLFPNLMLWWFLLCISNMSAPFSLNLFGEILILLNLMKFSYLLIIILLMLMFFSSIYSIYLFIIVNHGSMNLMMYMIYFNFVSEYILIIMHWFPLNFIFLKLNMLL